MKLEVTLRWDCKRKCWVAIAPNINPTGRVTGAITFELLEYALTYIRGYVTLQINAIGESNEGEEEE